jgi:hypothetical protein
MEWLFAQVCKEKLLFEKQDFPVGLPPPELQEHQTKEKAP